MSVIPADKCKVPQAFWRVVKQVGLSPSSVLRQARLPATLHLSDHAALTTRQYFAVWSAVQELSGDPALGLKLVTMADQAFYPPSTLVAFFASDFRDGLVRVARYKRLCTPEQLHFAQDRGSYSISNSWLHTDEPEPSIITDSTFAFLIELGRRGTGRSITPKRVDFVRKDEGHPAYGDYFGCPVHFGAARNTLVLDAGDLDRPFTSHNPEMLAILTPALASALEELTANTSTAERIKILLKRTLASGRPEISSIARELGVSERTLQRRMTDEGTTFRDLLLAARQELGRQLLSDPQAEIDEVACLLGYQDASSFYRAFREWEGVTPSQWRELNHSVITHPAAMRGLLN